MNDVVYAGQVESAGLAAIIKSITWDAALMMLERVPTTWHGPEGADPRICFERFDATRDFRQWPIGRVFDAQHEVSWTWLEHNTLQVIYTGNNADLPNLQNISTENWESFEASLKFTKQSFKALSDESISNDILEKLKPLENKEFTNKEKFLNALQKQIGQELTIRYETLILKHASLEPIQFLLWGKSVLSRDVAESPPLFFELQIPRLLSYPLACQRAETTRLAIRMIQYRDASTGQLQHYRFVAVEEAHESV